SLRRRDPNRRFRYALLAPAIFLFLFIGVFPFLQLLVTAFQNITMFEDDTSFNGFIHFARLLEDERLWGSILHTVLFTVVALPVQLILGFGLAILFLEHVPFKRLFIAIILLPTVIAPIVAGATWRLMFDQRFGPINQVISWITGEEVEILWTIDPLLVWPAILITEVWQWTPFMFLLLLAALSNLDPEPLEAASIDGAGWGPTLRWVVLPAILPVLFIAILIRALDLVRLFDVVWTLTQGGPGTLTETVSIYTYQVAFREFDISYSAAIALLMIIALTIVVMTVLRRVDLAR
ncbi:MAG: carbohydrate ABC transporter permease, partial [Chloroflexota bacterium]